MKQTRIGCSCWGIGRLLLMVCLGLMLMPVAGLWAHGGGTPRLTREPAGPYRVYAWSEPEPWRAGEVHFSIMVTQPIDDPQANRTEAPVTDADVTVVFTPVEGEGEPIRVEGVRQEYLNDYYFEADTELPHAGTWRITIDISGAQGAGSTDFTLTAQPARTVNWTLIGSAGAVVILGIALAGVWSRKQASAQSGSIDQPGHRRRTAGRTKQQAQARKESNST